MKWWEYADKVLSHLYLSPVWTIYRIQNKFLEIPRWRLGYFVIKNIFRVAQDTWFRAIWFDQIYHLIRCAARFGAIFLHIFYKLCSTVTFIRPFFTMWIIVSAVTFSRTRFWAEKSIIFFLFKNIKRTCRLVFPSLCRFCDRIYL